jgi:hypothetical protein
MRDMNVTGIIIETGKIREERFFYMLIGKSVIMENTYE